MSRDYTADLEIERDALDEEWLHQPNRYMYYAHQLAEAQRDADLAEEHLDVVRAEVDHEIRKDPESFGLEKVTEAGVKAKLPLQEKYRKALKRYIDCKYEAGLLASAVRAFDQRRAALENLVKLQGQGYFSQPRVSGEDATQMEERTSRSADDRVRNAAEDRLRRRGK